MNYTVIELQNGVVLYDTYTDRLQAEARHHTVLSFAAVSSVAVHTAMLVKDNGEVLKCESYSH